MLARAPIATPLCCLRCELRRIISYPRPFPTSSRCGPTGNRGLKATTICYREDDREDKATFLRKIKSDGRKKEMYRRQYPLGRIVGKPGRRQRERSETLSTPSMKEPFDVVLLQDVNISEETKEDLANGAITVSKGAQTTPAIASLDEHATEEEVRASIEELRPASQSIDGQTLDSLHREMLQRYNYTQLSSYLAHFSERSNPESTAVGGTRSSSSEDEIRRSEWRPGQTSLRVSHSDGQTSLRSRRGRSRKKVVQEILHSAWNLKVDDEGHIGELEMHLTNWQYRLLLRVDRRHDQSNYELMIQSTFLLRNSKIEHRSTDNTIRITARRGVAESIASLIENSLLEIVCMDLDLSSFSQHSPELVEKGNWNFAEQHTASVIERADSSTLNIYARSEGDRQQARRIILSILTPPNSSQIRAVETLELGARDRREIGPKNFSLILEANSADLHVRDRGRLLGRLAVSTNKQSEDDAMKRVGLHAKQQTWFAVRLGQILDDKQVLPGMSATKAESLRRMEPKGHYWRATPAQIESTWEAQLCRLLKNVVVSRPARSTSTSAEKLTLVQDSQSITQSHLPGINTLLSYFAPQDAFEEPSARPSILLAHFYPSPLTEQGVTSTQSLPRIELRYDLVNEYSKDDDKVRLSSMRAFLVEEDVRIPLPEETADLRFVRRRTLEADLGQILVDHEIQRFTEALQKSVSSAEGELAGEAMIKIKLPALLVADEIAESEPEATSGTVEVEYLFERFEQVQTAEFVAPTDAQKHEFSDEALRQAMEGMQWGELLQYRTSEGGVIGGSRTELAIVSRPDQPGHPLAVMQDKNRSLAQTALNILGCLTRINAGQFGLAEATKDEHRAKVDQPVVLEAT